jgi:hypothetical protein
LQDDGHPAEEGGSLQAAEVVLQQQEALVGQASSELSPALVKYVALEQQVRKQFKFKIELAPYNML